MTPENMQWFVHPLMTNEAVSSFLLSINLNVILKAYSTANLLQDMALGFNVSLY